MQLRAGMWSSQLQHLLCQLFLAFNRWNVSQSSSDRTVLLHTTRVTSIIGVSTRLLLQ